MSRTGEVAVGATRDVWTPQRGPRQLRAGYWRVLLYCSSIIPLSFLYCFSSPGRTCRSCCLRLCFPDHPSETACFGRPSSGGRSISPSRPLPGSRRRLPRRENAPTAVGGYLSMKRPGRLGNWPLRRCWHHLTRLCPSVGHNARLHSAQGFHTAPGWSRGRLPGFLPGPV